MEEEEECAVLIGVSWCWFRFYKICVSVIPDILAFLPRLWKHESMPQCRMYFVWRHFHPIYPTGGVYSITVMVLVHFEYDLHSHAWRSMITYMLLLLLGVTFELRS